MVEKKAGNRTAIRVKKVGSAVDLRARQCSQFLVKHKGYSEFVLLIVIIILIFVFSKEPGVFRVSEPAIAAIAALISAWVGLITLHTLRQAISISQEEARRHRLSTRPILIVRFANKDQSVDISRVPFEIENSGSGPALGITAAWVSPLVNYRFTTGKVVGVFALATGKSTRLSYQLARNPEDALTPRAFQRYDHQEKAIWDNEFNNGNMPEELYRRGVLGISADAAHSSGPYAGSFVLYYSGERGGLWKTTVELAIPERDNLPRRTQDISWPELIIDSQYVECVREPE